MYLQLSCNVRRDDVFTDGFLRSCGVLLITMNCQVIVGFAEILRSESRKEVLQALCNVFSVVPTLPRIIVYDAGCLLVRFLRSNYDNKSKNNCIRVSAESKILHDSVKWMIDRFHLNNHVQVSPEVKRMRSMKLTSNNLESPKVF